MKGGDVSALMERSAHSQANAEARTGEQCPLVASQEAGLTDFWIHRCLVRDRTETYVVDAASIAASRRSRHAKMDKRTFARVDAFDLVVVGALGSTLASILLSRDVAVLERVLARANAGAAGTSHVRSPSRR